MNDEHRPSQPPEQNGGEAAWREEGPPIPLESILEAEIQGGVRELRRPARGLLLSGLAAGLELGFGPLLMAVVITLADDAIHPLWRRLIVANAYTVGYIFVILGRSELYTEHTTLAVLPVMDGRSSIARLMRLWGLVYVANLVGAILIGVSAAFVGTSLGVVDEAALTKMVDVVVDYEWWVICVSGILCGWLMGLLSWLLRASEETISQLAVVWVVTGAIGLGQLHHCIAGTVKVAMGLFLDPTVGWSDFAHFLFFATLGNTIGGVVFVAAIKYGHARRTGHRP